MSELAKQLRELATAAEHPKSVRDRNVLAHASMILERAADALEAAETYARDDERRAWDGAFNAAIAGVVVADWKSEFSISEELASKSAGDYADAAIERRRERWPRDGGGDAPRIKGAGSPCKRCGACMNCESCESYAKMCDAAADVLSEALGLEVQRHGVLEGINMLAGRVKASGRGLAIEPQYRPKGVNR